VLLRIGTGITLAFMYVPLAVIALYAFNARRTLKWPIPGLTLEWFDKAFHNPGVREALRTVAEGGAPARRWSRSARHAGVARGLRTGSSAARRSRSSSCLPLGAAGRGHRHGAERDVPRGAHAARHRALACSR
jgi:hypothetical protein